MAKPKFGLVVGYAVSLVGGVIALAAYARVLGPSEYGRFAVYLAVVEAIQTVLFQWHRLAVVRFWAENKKTDFSSFLKTYNLSWCGMALAIIVGMGLYKISPWGQGDAVWPLVIALAISKSAALYAQEVARAEGASVRYAVGAVLLTIGAALLGVLAYWETQSISSVLIVMALIYALSAFICAAPAFFVSRSGNLQRRHLPEMLRYGLPLIPVFLASNALTRLDRLILANFEAASIVGVYAAATALITNAVSAAFLLIVTPTYPWLLSQRVALEDQTFRRVHVGVGMVMICSALCVSIAFYCGRDLIFPLLLGQEIGKSAGPLVLPLLCISVIGAFRAHFFDQAFHLFNQTRVLMIINFATMIVAVPALYLGAYFGGLHGMIWGSAIANIVSMGLSMIACRSLIALWLLARDAIKIVGIGGLVVLVTEQANGYFQRGPSTSPLWNVGLALVSVVAFMSVSYLLYSATIRKLLQGRT